MAEAMKCQILYIGRLFQVLQMDDKSPLQGAWFGSRDPFLHVQLWTYKDFGTARP